MSDKTTGPRAHECPIIEGLMMVRLDANDADHPAIDAAIAEIERLRRGIRDMTQNAIEAQRMLIEDQREERRWKAAAPDWETGAIKLCP